MARVLTNKNMFGSTLYFLADLRLKRGTIASLLVSLLFVSLASTLQSAFTRSVLPSTVASVQAQTQYTVSTDESVYYVGETVTIYAYRPIVIGAVAWLVVTKPDGSQARIDPWKGSEKSATATITAGPQVGRCKIEIWTQGMMPNPPPAALAAYCYYEVAPVATTTSTTVSPKTTKFQGTLTEEPVWSIGFQSIGIHSIRIEQILSDSLGLLATGSVVKVEAVWTDVANMNPKVDKVHKGDRVEVIGVYGSTWSPPSSSLVLIPVTAPPNPYYLILAPSARLVVDVWTDKGGQGRNVPDGTYQEGEQLIIYYSVSASVIGSALYFEGPYKYDVVTGRLAQGTHSRTFILQNRDIGKWKLTFTAQMESIVPPPPEDSDTTWFTVTEKARPQEPALVWPAIGVGASVIVLITLVITFRRRGRARGNACQPGA